MEVKLTPRLRPFVVFTLLFPVATELPAQTAQIEPEALVQIQALMTEKARWTTGQRKLSSSLVLGLKRQQEDPLFDALLNLRPGVEIGGDGRVLVDLRAEVTPGLLTEIEARGGTVESQHPSFDSVRARLPLGELEALANSPEVRFIRPAERAITGKVNSSEGDVAHAVDLSRTTFSIDGSGVQVGVLSDSVDALAALQASGDLPATVTVLPGQSGNLGTSEGTAMLEIVFDLAPGAELYFATGFSGQAQMAQNILDLQAAGCDVIVDDVFYPEEPAFQDGVIAQAVETVTAAGANYFSSAGNSGNVNDGTSGVWEGDFVGIAGPGPLSGATAHDFGGGTNFDTLTVDPPFGMSLHWADPQGGSGNDYDLILLDPTLTFVVDASFDVQDGDDDPIEFIDSEPFDDTGLNLVVIQNTGAADRYFHMNTIRGQLAIATAGQTGGHAAAASAFGVAAVNAATAGGGVFTGGPANPVETFSSDGPRRVFFDAGGSPITPGDFSSTGGEVRQKPDIAAADGVATATPGFNPFFGTSAAAPHAAAIAALMQEIGNLTTEGMREVFAATALDIEAPGFDRDSGFGLLQARDVVGTVSPVSPACYADDLSLTGTPNNGPQTFRACQTITWGPGVFDDVTGVAETHIFVDGFESGDTSVWSNSVP